MAGPKSKARRMKRERKRQRRAKRQRKSALVNSCRLKRGIAAQGALPPMSQVLLDFAAPLLEGVPDDRNELERVLLFAGALWNGSMLGEDAPNTILDVLQQVGSRRELCEEVEAYAERRRTQFGWDPRMILEVWVEEQKPGGFRAMAMSTVTEWRPEPSDSGLSSHKEDHRRGSKARA